MNQDSIIWQQGPLSAPTFTSVAKQPAFQVNYQLVTVQTPSHFILKCDCMSCPPKPESYQGVIIHFCKMPLLILSHPKQ